MPTPYIFTCLCHVIVTSWFSFFFFSGLSHIVHKPRHNMNSEIPRFSHITQLLYVHLCFRYVQVFMVLSFNRPCLKEHDGVLEVTNIEMPSELMSL